VEAATRSLWACIHTCAKRAEFRVTQRRNDAFVRAMLDGVPDEVRASVGARAVADLSAGVRRGGWRDGELEEAVRRRVGERALALLVASPVSPMWRNTSDVVRLAALLSALPLERETAPRRSASRPRVNDEDARRLATVRALLAKAERTPYDAEAEALSAKAQELIAKHSLERILLEHERGAPSSDLEVVRLWLDAPYVMPKALLVDSVARANRSRCLVSESLGMCTVLGHPEDLDAIELLVTSLLVQATRAMLRLGSLKDRSGASRTRSFRQSFLVAFAGRIGERLAQARDLVAETAPPGTEPSGARRVGTEVALLGHERRLDDEMSARFLHTTSTGSRVTNVAGWAAGRAAADLASLQTRRGIRRGPPS
jgi:hypothetical protein